MAYQFQEFPKHVQSVRDGQLVEVIANNIDEELSHADLVDAFHAPARDTAEVADIVVAPAPAPTGKKKDK